MYHTWKPAIKTIIIIIIIFIIIIIIISLDLHQVNKLL